MAKEETPPSRPPFLGTCWGIPRPEDQETEREMGACTTDDMAHAEEVVREFLLHRGLARTLQCFEDEVAEDVLGADASEIQVLRVMNLIFSEYIPGFLFERLKALLRTLRCRVALPREPGQEAALAQAESSLVRRYLVHAAEQGNAGEVLRVCHSLSEERRDTGEASLAARALCRGSGGSAEDSAALPEEELYVWFSAPFLSSDPGAHPLLRLFFSDAWKENVLLGTFNLLSATLGSATDPVLLRFNAECRRRSQLEASVESSRLQLARQKVQLRAREREIASLLQGNPPSPLSRLPALSPSSFGSPLQSLSQSEGKDSDTTTTRGINKPVFPTEGSSIGSTSAGSVNAGGGVSMDTSELPAKMLMERLSSG